MPLPLPSCPHSATLFVCRVRALDICHLHSGRGYCGGGIGKRRRSWWRRQLQLIPTWGVRTGRRVANDWRVLIASERYAPPSCPDLVILLDESWRLRKIRQQWNRRVDTMDRTAERASEPRRERGKPHPLLHEWIDFNFFSPFDFCLIWPSCSANTKPKQLTASWPLQS